MPTQLNPQAPVAMVHLAHVDRHLAQIPGGYTVLDNRPIAEMCGDLTQDGIQNDFFVLALQDSEGGIKEDAYERFKTHLKAYPTVVFDKPWSDAWFQRLKTDLPDLTVIVRGVNHRVMDPPVDYTCQDENRETIPYMLSYLMGREEVGPKGVKARTENLWLDFEDSISPPEKERVFAPNLNPTVINPELLPAAFSYAIEGQHGCPFQEDARDNPFYADVHLPKALGVGCSFCPAALEFKADGATVSISSVVEQLRYIRKNAPDMEILVLRDQLPFAYLPRAMKACVEEGLTGFTLLLETRADWLLQGSKRFDEALQIAHKGGIAIAPYLIGIENFSQQELDRLNKGIEAETNIEFLDHIWAWKGEYGDTLNLSYAMFGFILFTPWTTLKDLRINLEGIKRTRLLEFFGGILKTKLMPFPDTTIYYLLARDGLIKNSTKGADKTLAKKYDEIVRPGQYLPYADWFFEDTHVQKLAELAWESSKQIHVDQELEVLERLVVAFEGTDDPSSVCLGDILKDLAAPEGFHPEGGPVRFGSHASLGLDDEWPTPGPDLNQRAFSLLGVDGPELWDGWQLEATAGDPETLCMKLGHASEAAFIAEIGPSDSGPCFREVGAHAIRYRGSSLSAAQQGFLEVLSERLQA